MLGETIAKSVIGSIFLTVWSYFNGGMRFPFEEGDKVPPLWLQFLGKFIYYILLLVCLIYLFRELQALIKRKGGRGMLGETIAKSSAAAMVFTLNFLFSGGVAYSREEPFNFPPVWLQHFPICRDGKL